MDKKKKGNFIFSIIVVSFIAIWSIFFKDNFNYAVNTLYSIVTDNFSWLYLLVMLYFVFFALYIAFSKYGKIKLGKKNDEPEYSTFTWFAMLFCAGMGVGLVFWGISEPMTHYIAPLDLESMSDAANKFAFRSVFMHWGIHPWAAYAVVGLAMAYTLYKENKPMLVSETIMEISSSHKLKYVLKEIIDTLAIFATVAGVVTSLGLGVLQINSGLNFLYGVPNTLVIQISIILCITGIFVFSACSGINKGIKKLSNLTLGISILIMIFCFGIGPKLEMANNLVSGLGAYLSLFLEDSLRISTYGDNSWVTNWRVFYWAWWIAWAPFVGCFIAKISKGRTVKEFILGVVFAPTIGSILWFTIMGTLGIHLEKVNKISMDEIKTITSSPEIGVFVVFKQYPLGTAISIVVIILLFLFFVTSADSGTFVLAMFSSNGDAEPGNLKKIVWGVIQSLLAIGLLIAGGLKPLQTISIVAAAPFAIIMVCETISILHKFSKE